MKSLFFVLPALLLGLTACGAPVAAVTLPDTVQVEKTRPPRPPSSTRMPTGVRSAPAAPP